MKYPATLYPVFLLLPVCLSSAMELGGLERTTSHRSLHEKLKALRDGIAATLAAVNSRDEEDTLSLPPGDADLQPAEELPAQTEPQEVNWYSPSVTELKLPSASPSGNWKADLAPVEGICIEQKIRLEALGSSLDSAPKKFVRNEKRILRKSRRWLKSFLQHCRRCEVMPEDREFYEHIFLLAERLEVASCALEAAFSMEESQAEVQGKRTCGLLDQEEHRYQLWDLFSEKHFSHNCSQPENLHGPALLPPWEVSLEAPDKNLGQFNREMQQALNAIPPEEAIVTKPDPEVVPQQDR